MMFAQPTDASHVDQDGREVDEAQLRAAFARISRLTSSGEPEHLRGYLVAPSDKPLIAGSTVPALGQFVQTRGGILIPATARVGAAPIDLALSYIIISELVDQAPDLAWCARNLAGIPLSHVLGFVSGINVRLQKTMSRSDADREAAMAWFEPATAQKVLNLLKEPRALLNAQANLVLAKLAITHAKHLDGPAGEEGNAIPLLLLAVAEEMALGGRDADRDLLVLESEVVANQYFNAPVDPAHLTGRFVRRWLDLPSTTNVTPSFDLKATFEEATGCALWDVSTVALGFWSAVDVGQTRFHKSYFASLGWEPERLDRVWRLLSADRDHMRALIELERGQLGDHSLSWAFSPFERYPLFRLPDDSVIVLSPDLLVRRVFGWLPFFDVRSTLSGKTRGQFEHFFRKVTEAYAVEVLASIATDRDLRFYAEAEIEAAYAAEGVQLADTVIEAVDAFIVTEIGTHQLTRETVAGVSHAKLQTDLAAILEKARQVHSTIGQLRADEERLTGQSPLPGRRYYPVVIATEGFPANPVTLTRLWDLLREEGLLQEPTVAPLQVLDLIELEMVEGAQEDGGPSFRSLLDGKKRGGMARASLRDHMIVELGLQPSRPHRLDALWQQPFDIAAAQLDADFDPSEPA